MAVRARKLSLFAQANWHPQSGQARACHCGSVLVVGGRWADSGRNKVAGVVTTEEQLPFSRDQTESFQKEEEQPSRCHSVTCS